MNNILNQYCSKEWIEFITFHSEVKTYKANTFIFQAEEEVKGVYIIETGKVKVITKTDIDQERIIRLTANGQILGHRGLGGDWKYNISAITLEETQLIFIPITIFDYAVKANPELAYFIIMFYAEELRESENMMSLIPVKNSVASVLYKNLIAFGYAADDSQKLSLTIARKDIANFAGVRYETVIRVLAELQKEKIIKLKGKDIYILDKERLLAVSKAK